MYHHRVRLAFDRAPEPPVRHTQRFLHVVVVFVILFNQETCCCGSLTQEEEKQQVNKCIVCVEQYELINIDQNTFTILDSSVINKYTTEYFVGGYFLFSFVCLFIYHYVGVLLNFIVHIMGGMR